MTIQLINGHFNSEEAVDIINQMIQIKIKFQESKITADRSEEDIKMRETRIRQLQQSLTESRNFIKEQNGNIAITSNIQLN